MYRKVTIQSYAYPLLIAFALPVFIGIFSPKLLAHILSIVFSAVFFLACILPIIVFCRALLRWRFRGESLFFSVLEQIRPLPSGIVYGTDLVVKRLPIVTIFLVFINTLLYLFTPPDMINQFAFLPAGDPGIFQMLLSVFTSAFFHGSLFHLMGNMIFLWIFGRALEARTGARLFLFFYFFSIVASTLLVTFLLCVQVGFIDIELALSGFRSIGASGAIAGIIGAFVVRCFFARLTFTLPFFSLPFLSVPIRVQATVLIALLFSLDIAGSVYQFHVGGKINYWAHAGGYMGAVLLAYIMGLQKEAVKEAVHAEAERYSQNEQYAPEAIDAYNEILESNPEDEKAIAFFFHLHRFDPEKQGNFFGRLVDLLVKTDFKKAQELFDEYYQKYIHHLGGRVLFQLGMEFSRLAEFHKAMLCLEFAAEDEGPWQKKALLELARIYEDMQLDERAIAVYEEVISLYPRTEFSKEAAARMNHIAH